MAQRGNALPVVPLDPSTGILLPNGSQILGFTVDDPDSFSGISAPEVLYLVDEASGVKDAVFEAIMGNLAGGGKLVETGNPTTTTGHFFDSFHDKRNLFEEGALLHISSLESPNILAGEIVVPGLAEPIWAEEMAREYGGPGEPVWDVRVGGDFPKSGPNVVVPLFALEAALELWREDPSLDPAGTASGKLCIGADIARYGDDDTVIAWKRGDYGGTHRTIHGAPTTEVTGEIVSAAKELRRGNEPVVIGIDEGGLGAGVVDGVIEELRDIVGLSVVGINSAQSANDTDRFDRIRDEMWWMLREWLVDGAALEPNHELERELVAPTYSLTPAGKIRVESQDSIKKRLKRSPDHANAMGLALACESGAVDYSGAAETNKRLIANTRLHSRFGPDAMRARRSMAGRHGRAPF